MLVARRTLSRLATSTPHFLNSKKAFPLPRTTYSPAINSTGSASEITSGIFARTLNNVTIEGQPFKQVIHESLFTSWLSPHLASLAYALTWVAGWFLVLGWMYRRRIFIKI